MEREYDEQDQTLTCLDCGQPFVWSAGSQKFFAAMNFTPPKRCGACREKKRARYDAAGRNNQ
jgi:hypothetical protein